MNQIQTLIDAGREALTSNGIHDTILAVGIAAIPILIFCVIVNRLRHPDRSFLAALAVSVLGFFLVPSVATGTAILWVYTGGAGGQEKRKRVIEPCTRSTSSLLSAQSAGTTSLYGEYKLRPELVETGSA